MSHFCFMTAVHADRPVAAEYLFVRQRMTGDGVSFDLRLLCGHHTEVERQRSNHNIVPVAVRTLRPSPLPYDTDYLLGIVRELLGLDVDLIKRNGLVWLDSGQAQSQTG